MQSRSQSPPSTRHSEAYLGRQREFWWKHDFLQLIAKRCGLNKEHSLAEVGCGWGHWSKLLFPYLKPPARLLAIDREPAWVNRTRELLATSRLDGRFEACVGDAQELPVQSNSFDAVTCQTLLMHLSRPARGLKEMIRIARPGGLILCAEPNNLFNMIAYNCFTPQASTETLVSSFEFWLRFQRGKAMLGEGNNAIGEYLPGMFANLGLLDIQVYQRDTAFALFPPYDGAEQQALLEQNRFWEESETGPWNREEVRRYVLAGGGSDSMVARQFQSMRRGAIARRKAIAQRQFHSAGGGVFYLVCGRKPPCN
jgi:ubiquinone/menaquinone biosynthesis C-methylase UbiE